MKFERRQLSESKGAILAHNISDGDGKRILRKGTIISNAETRILQDLGRQFIYVAELEDSDVGEAEAAREIAKSIKGQSIRMVGASTGRTNLLSRAIGVLQIDVERLNALNTLSGLTVSTLRDRTVVIERQMVASIKIIPYGLPADTIETVKEISGTEPIVHILPLQPRQVHLMLLGGSAVLRKLERDFRAPLEKRVSALGSRIAAIHTIDTDGEDPLGVITSALSALNDQEIDLLIMAGETAIMDPRDIIPAAIELAGGRVAINGAPVDPGNLLMIAYLDDLPILGAPGCARSPKENVVDWILPRLLTGERLEQSDVSSLGHGGLLEDIAERSFPRSKAWSESDA